MDLPKRDELPSSPSPTSPPSTTKLTVDDKAGSLPTSPIPFSPSSPLPRIEKTPSPPPSYASGSFRRCDNKKPSSCVYCGGAGNTKNPLYWEPKAQAQLFLERSQQALRAMTFLGLALFFIVVFILLIYGNQHFFQQKTFSGWCGTSFVDENNQPRHFAQEMEINPNELYEKIQVPKFGMNRPAVFVHDFRKNITAIVDVLGDRCFLKTLDRSVVAPPKNFIDLIQKMETGYYAQNPRVIHETFRVGSQLTHRDIAEIDSTMVSRHCNGRDVYQLVKASRTLDAPYFIRDKREATEHLQFSVLNGDNVEIESIEF